MLYLRYIDIFMKQKGTHNQFQVFLKKLNKQHPTIKFDWKISKEEIAFLGTKIYIDDNKNIQATDCREKADRQSFLH